MDTPNHEDIIKNPRGFNKHSLKKRYADFYKYLNETYPNIKTTIEKLYLYMHNMANKPLCICGNELEFLTYKDGYRQYCCAKCSWSDGTKLEKIKKTNLERYGVEAVSKNPNIKDKIIQTHIDRYGGMGMASEKIRDKIENTNVERYGTSNAMQSEEVQSRLEQTCIERYGTKHAISSKQVREKIKKTFLDKYGVEQISTVQEIKDKVNQTCIERYGGRGLASKEIKDKAKNTSIMKYHTHIPSQSEIVKKNTIKKFQEKYNVDCGLQATLFDKYPDLLGISDKVWVMKCPHPECNKCEERFYKTRAMIYHDRVIHGTELCTNILPISKSNSTGTTIELFVRNILDEYNIEYLTNVRNIISPKELDIYIPSKNLAIECNGIYWHSSNKLCKKYHMDKYKKCDSLGIQLITIWEDQIKSDPEKIKSLILYKLGISEKTIYARKCIVKQLEHRDCKEFLQNNHIQGAVNGSYKLGLYHEDELVSVMVFGTKRIAIGDKSKDVELLRFCSKNKYNVVGAAGKLFKYFINNYECDKIISYSSNDISNGNLYETLGFKYSGMNDSYWYISPKEQKRYHRYNFTKHKLVALGYDASLTEREIMENMGFLKIFDSGQKTWIYQK